MNHNSLIQAELLGYTKVYLARYAYRALRMYQIWYMGGFLCLSYFTNLVRADVEFY